MVAPVLSTSVDNRRGSTKMSTSVDKSTRERLSAAQCRERIIDAARFTFTRAGYDAVGVREIAARAGVDPAMVSRLFGSKEALFSVVADEAFSLEPAFVGPVDTLAHRIARHLLGPIRKSESEAFDEFAFLLRSVGSPVAAPILAAALHRDFVEPLARHIGKKDAQERAAMITAYVMGFAVLRAGLGSAAIERAKPQRIVSLLAAAIQTCLIAE
ncbi:TetR/AcrR family transcriptional regulator [Paraburkholderia strydomiana]|uniref:TetR/AcrR family transcriptional regulator n=1 Tax=Paraburkholderia strydomiana TaxID=1245417 RepID=UPI002858DA3A|nr:TetR family transcriptional regulator [Paraburkholderia strydomiana]MDR7009314.1 AcrR family transcriptional regulator [Paraburkholderia strydomiana]